MSEENKPVEPVSSSAPKEVGDVMTAAAQLSADIGGPLADGFQPKQDLMQMSKNVLSHLQVYLDAAQGGSSAVGSIKNMSKADILDAVGDLIKAEAKIVREASAKQVAGAPAGEQPAVASAAPAPQGLGTMGLEQEVPA